VTFKLAGAGAGGRNRTDDTALEERSFTTKLHPQARRQHHPVLEVVKSTVDFVALFFIDYCCKMDCAPLGFVCIPAIAIISPTTGQGAGLRQSAGQKRRSSFTAAQSVAKLKVLEKSQEIQAPLGGAGDLRPTVGLPHGGRTSSGHCLEARQDQTEDQCLLIVSVRCVTTSRRAIPSPWRLKKFPNALNALFVSMVEASAASGGLAEILGKGASYFEASFKLTPSRCSRLITSRVTSPNYFRLSQRSLRPRRHALSPLGSSPAAPRDQT